MATVTGLTAERMLQIEAESIVDAALSGTNLILTRHDGTTIDVGNVQGPQGVQGPPYVNGVDTVSDQSIAGFKTFTNKPSIEVGAAGVALHIGIVTAGMNDALNICPYGAAAVVLASGATFGATSTAKAGSASQIEMLNSGINFFADTGLTPDVTYARTKVMSIDNTGQLQIIRPALGSSVWVKKGAASMGGGSVVVGRGATTEAQSLVFSLGVGVNYIIGRDSGMDALMFGTDGGSGFTERLRIGTDGGIQATGDQHWFGSNALGATGGRIRIYAPAGDATNCYIIGESSGANISMHLQAKGTGNISLRSGDGVDHFIVNSDGKINIQQAAVYFVTTATAGGANALPGNPVGYWVVNINGTDRKIPYYAY